MRTGADRAAADPYAATGLPWVPPSPNLPTPDTAMVYPGTGLFEATNLSEGRGTTRPFELVGAPYLDHRWAERLTEAQLPGVRFRSASFQPVVGKHADEVCHGVQLYVDDPAVFDPVLTGTTMITSLVSAAKAEHPGFAWRAEADGRPSGRWIDLLTGSDRFRRQVESGATPAEVAAGWADELAAFDRQRRPYLLYPR